MHTSELSPSMLETQPQGADLLAPALRRARDSAAQGIVPKQPEMAVDKPEKSGDG